MLPYVVSIDVHYMLTHAYMYICYSDNAFCIAASRELICSCITLAASSDADTNGNTTN